MGSSVTTVIVVSAGMTSGLTASLTVDFPEEAELPGPPREAFGASAEEESEGEE